MSNNKTDEELLLEEFEAMLNGLDEEKDFGFYHPTVTWDYSAGDDYTVVTEDLPPPVPEKNKCEHKEREVKRLIYTEYYVCKNCKEDLGNVK